jgi:agmatine deiminase
MPAEWTRHQATWISYPFDSGIWHAETWPDLLEHVRDEVARLIATISRFEPVVVNVRDKATEADARSKLSGLCDLSAIKFFRMPLDDSWFRDNGPIFVVKDDGSLVLTDWQFNAWGRAFPHWQRDNDAAKLVARNLNLGRISIPLVLEGGAIDVNGSGVLLTTKPCLLNTNRNPNYSQTDIEAILARYLGIDEVVWLEGGLVDDDTDGHVDTIARFANEHTLVCAVADEQSPHHDTLAANLDILQTFADSHNLNLVTLPLPHTQRVIENKLIPQSYANFYIGNGFVVVPQYEDEHDEDALTRLTPLFPGRKVIGLSAWHLVVGGGAFHCITQQQPLLTTLDAS